MLVLHGAFLVSYVGKKKKVAVVSVFGIQNEMQLELVLKM